MGKHLRSVRRVLAGVALAVLGVAGTSSSAQSATTFCVGGGPGCYVTIQAALDAAHDGDTISVGRGTFAGGITIEKSVRLVGVGAAATIISGGGPVVTIGDVLGDSTPVVSISRVTITGGVNESRPNGAVARGGGVSIRSPGATVAISDSIVADNRVTPQASGFALGGGIDNAGTLVVLNTRVSNNEVGSAAASGSPAFNARAGGINNQPGAALTLRHTVVTGNRVAVTAANARLAVAGGISDFGGVLSIDDSVVGGNSVEADTATPGEVESFTGGIEVTAAGSATITRTTVRDNTVRGVNVGGDAMVGVGGISTDPGVTFVLRDCAVSHNSVYLQTTGGSSDIANVGGLDLEGHVDVSRCQFVGNTVQAKTSSGFTIAIAGGLETRGLEPFTISDSLVADNSVVASTTDGFVAAAGGGIFNGGLLTLLRTRVVDNRVRVAAPAGFAQGGGIWNSLIPIPGAPPDAELTLIDGVVAANRLITSPGLDAAGAGIFSSVPVSLRRTVIDGNSPDQCVGC
jgi:hypothetical protein